jgi:hypothetical protein
MSRPCTLPRACLATLLVAAAVAWVPAARAGTVSGAVGFIGEAVPALRITAWQPATGEQLAFTTVRDQRRYTVTLPAGRWILFAHPDEPGAPDVYGAHTRFAACSRNPQALRAGGCTDHSLVEVQVWRSGRVEGADLTDWYLDDDTAARLDTVLGRAPGELPSPAVLAAPRFTEYPAVLLPTGSIATAVTGSPADPRAQRDQAALAAALGTGLQRGANFAGSLVLVPVPATCGADCTGYALLDLRTGLPQWPAVLAELRPVANCPGAAATAGAVRFRRDSRLLTVTQREGDQRVTRYLVWNDATDRLESVATLSSSATAKCTE